jgi:hypothetical protein
MLGLNKYKMHVIRLRISLILIKDATKICKYIPAQT